MEIHKFKDGGTAEVTRDNSETLPVIRVITKDGVERDRNSVARAGQRALYPGERLVPVRVAVKSGRRMIWLYTASEVADKASDQARLDRNRAAGTVNKMATFG